MEKNESLAAPPSKQKHRSRGEWLKEIRSLGDSSLSAKEYATKKGFVFSTLKHWMRVLGDDVEDRTKSAVPAFLPVSVLPAAKAPSYDAAVMVEIDLANGRRLRMHVRPNTDFKRVSDLLVDSRNKRARANAKANARWCRSRIRPTWRATRPAP